VGVGAEVGRACHAGWRVLALFIPLKPAGAPYEALPAIRLEHVIKPWSAWVIMPGPCHVGDRRTPKAGVPSILMRL
jgi:hypothetical protein